VRYAERGRIFTYTVDGKKAYENGLITNLNALSNHTISVIDQNSNFVYQSSFRVADGETVHVSPEEQWGGPFHILAYTGNSAYAGLGLQYFPLRYLWIEAGSGVSWSNSIYDISPRIDAGYYAYGDMTADLRFGLGVTAGYYQYTPAGNYSPPYSYSAGVFALAEWKWIFLKLGCSYDFGASQFFPAIEAGFKL
jgi:hypothetical protein